MLMVTTVVVTGFFFNVNNKSIPPKSCYSHHVVCGHNKLKFIVRSDIFFALAQNSELTGNVYR